MSIVRVATNSSRGYAKRGNNFLQADFWILIRTFFYSGGTTTYLEVLDGQRSLFSAELTLAQARGDEYQSLVQLYKALGGGGQQQVTLWTSPTPHID